MPKIITTRPQQIHTALSGSRYLKPPAMPEVLDYCNEYKVVYMFLDQKVTRQDVVYTYRLLLGREPESQKVFDNWVGKYTVGQMRKEVLSSDEFKQTCAHPMGEPINNSPAPKKGGFLWETPRNVQRLEDCYFYHTLDIPGYGLQPGAWDLRGCFDQYVGWTDLKDKRILDVGTASGFLTFSAEQSGAREVVSIDLDHAASQNILPFVDSLAFTNHELWCTAQNESIEKMKNGYWLAHKAFQSKALVHYSSVYDLPKELGPFDIAFVGSTLEHFADPIKALASISRLVQDKIIINTEIPNVLRTNERLAYFMGDADKPEINYVFWLYSPETLRHILKIVGFEIIQMTDDTYYRPEVNHRSTRTTLVAQRRQS